MAANIQPQAGRVPPVVYINFSAEINPNTTESLLALMADCANKQVPDVYLMISTPGGSVMNGMNLYNVLRAMPFTLTTHNVGNVDSIGNLVFLAGTKRYASPHSTFMFHGVGFNVPPNQRFDEPFLRERLEGILADQQRIGAIIEEHSNLTGDQLAELFRGAQTKDAAYAVGCGIVDEIRDVEIAPGCPVVSLVFQR
jgi:ATP-dependent Clp protease, protease subunit